MNKYNIYKVDKDREEDLIAKLEKVKVCPRGSIEEGGFTITMYVSDEPDERPLWWRAQYDALLAGERAYTNKVYCAVVIASSPALCYAVSLGKSHFYIKEFSNPDFGLELGVRIANPKKFKRKNSQHFGGKKTKGITLYGEDAGIDIDSGESIDYFRAHTNEPKKWGRSISFGGSVLMTVSQTPAQLPQLFGMIEDELKKPPLISLPRALRVTDKAKQKELDDALVKDILSGRGATSSGELALSGIEFIFRENAHFTIKLGRKRSEKLAVLTPEALLQFCREKRIDLKAELQNLKVEAEEDGRSSYTKPLKYFLEYVSEPYFLKDGNWHLFNRDYVKFVEEQADTIEMVDKSAENLVDSEHSKWKAGQPDGAITYAEYYFNKMREAEGYKLMDREMESLKAKYSIEKLDLMRDGDFVYVKIGEPAGLGYAIDQSMVALRLIAQNPLGIEIDGKPTRPKRSILWFVLERKTPISKASKFKSLILLMKLCEWQRACRNAGVDPVIYCSYRRD